MVKFYVYTSAKADGQSELEFIEADSIQNFAEHEFNPGTMEFSGIAIEAKDLGKAIQVYHHPTSQDGEYLFEDEPIATTVRKTLNISFEKLKAQLEYQRYLLIMKLIAAKLSEANQLLNEVVHGIYDLANQPEDTTPEKVFNDLSRKILKMTIKYNGDTKSTG